MTMCFKLMQLLAITTMLLISEFVLPGTTVGGEDVPKKTTEDNEVLSVEQTVAICYSLPHKYLTAAANPASRGHIRRIVADKESGRAGAYALDVLGEIGESADVESCVRIIEQECAKATPDTQRIEHAHTALGRLAARNVGKSRDYLHEMCESGFWADVRFDAFRRASASSGRFEEFTLPRAIYAIAEADSPTAARLAKDAVSSYSGTAKEQWAAARFDQSKIEGHVKALTKERGREVTNDDRLTLNAVYRRIDPAQIRRLDLPSPDGLPVPQISASLPKELPRELTVEQRNEIAAEARAGYSELAVLMRKERFHELLPRVLDNGQFVSAPKQSRDKERMIDGLRESRRFLLEVDRVDSIANEPTVSVKGDGNGGDGEIVTVTWNLSGTEEIGRRLWNAGTGKTTLDKRKATLIVVMKRKEGVWYWNPFGW